MKKLISATIFYQPWSKINGAEDFQINLKSL